MSAIQVSGTTPLTRMFRVTRSRTRSLKDQALQKKVMPNQSSNFVANDVSSTQPRRDDSAQSHTASSAVLFTPQRPPRERSMQSQSPSNPNRKTSAKKSLALPLEDAQIGLGAEPATAEGPSVALSESFGGAAPAEQLQAAPKKSQKKTNKQQQKKKNSSGSKRVLDTQITPASTPGAPRSAGRVTHTPLRTATLNAADFRRHAVSNVYRLIRKATGALGGDGTGGAIYGEITERSFQRVVDFLKTHCHFNSQSKFIDVGSGLGKPNFHVAVDPGVCVSYGVELEHLRWQLSLQNLRTVMTAPTELAKESSVIFTKGDITEAESFDPFTHVYSFDVGFPPAAMFAMARAFNESSSANFLVSFHNPKKVIDIYGYDVEQVQGGKIATSMCGSSEGHTCYVYCRRGANNLFRQFFAKEHTSLWQRQQQNGQENAENQNSNNVNDTQSAIALGDVEHKSTVRLSQGRKRTRGEMTGAELELSESTPEDDEESEDGGAQVIRRSSLLRAMRKEMEQQQPQQNYTKSELNSPFSSSACDPLFAAGLTVLARNKQEILDWVFEQDEFCGGGGRAQTRSSRQRRTRRQRLLHDASLKNKKVVEFFPPEKKRRTEAVEEEQALARIKKTTLRA